jgi:prepilin-type N-terminal cleavage/methylation domain-containing protein
MLNSQKGFTLLEMVLTIVILSIVATVGTKVTIALYESYLNQQAQHNALLKCELTALQIVNRLENAIPSTIVVENNHTITWKGNDIDGFLAVSSGSQKLPAWSGFCDINHTLQTGTIITPGSNLNLLNTIHTNLNGGTLPQRTLYFIDTHHTTVSTTPVSVYNATQFTATLPNKISERYMLSWSHYSIKYHTDTKTLKLHYQNRTQRLATEVTDFSITTQPNLVSFKLCISERLFDASILNACREKGIIYD